MKAKILLLILISSFASIDTAYSAEEIIEYTKQKFPIEECSITFLDPYFSKELKNFPAKDNGYKQIIIIVDSWQDQGIEDTKNYKAETLHEQELNHQSPIRELIFIETGLPFSIQVCKKKNFKTYSTLKARLSLLAPGGKCFYKTRICNQNTCKSLLQHKAHFPFEKQPYFNTTKKGCKCVFLVERFYSQFFKNLGFYNVSCKKFYPKKIPHTVRLTAYKPKLLKNPSNLAIYEPKEVMRQLNKPTQKRCNMCGKLAKHKKILCKKCKQAYYCTRKCQKRDWLRGHKKDCSNSFYPEIDIFMQNFDKHKNQLYQKKTTRLSQNEDQEVHFFKPLNNPDLKPIPIKVSTIQDNHLETLENLRKINEQVRLSMLISFLYILCK